MEASQMAHVKREVDMTKSPAIDDREWVEHERAKLIAFDGVAAKRAKNLGPINLIYLEMVEADGRLDGAAAALGYLMSMDYGWNTERQMIQSQWPRLQRAINALIDGNGSPMALCQAAFALVDGGVVTNGRGDQWLMWATKLFLLSALAQQPDRGPDSATYLFAAGWFYATTATSLQDQLQSVRLLDEARSVAAEHRSQWILPENVQNAADISVKDAKDSWKAVCFIELRVLLDIARSLDEHWALRAVQAAYGLAVSSDLDNQRRAPVLYELGVRRQAIGDTDGAIQAFHECAAAVAATTDDSRPNLGVEPDLDLDALLRAALLSPVLPEDDVLNWIMEDALARHNVRITVKAIVARGRVAVDRGRLNTANGFFLLARRLIAVHVDCVDPEDAERARAPLTWFSPDGQVSMNAEQMHDAVTESKAKIMLLQLQSRKNNNHDQREDETSTNRVSKKNWINPIKIIKK